MAITGTGTQGDPYIVHNYSELRELYTFSGDEMKYAKLGNDINCNDYGEDFEWESVRLGDGSSSGMTMTLDLDGHTISNTFIALNQTMFQLETYGGRGSKIINGKLANIFNKPNSTKAFITGGGMDCEVQDLSISACCSAGSHGVLESLTPKNVSAYIYNYGNITNLFLKANSTACVVKNCYINIDGGNNVTSPIIDINNSATYGVQDCKITGTVKGSLCSKFVANTKMNQCVVHIDASEATFTAMSGGIKTICSSGSNGVCNVTDLPTDGSPSTYASGLAECTRQEMYNASALRAKGFNVISV